jgi:glycine cleavage system transcriptional repressor
VRKRYVLTMTAANRVGILAAVTNALAEVGGDLVEIRQTVLRGYFTMIIAADFPADREAGLVRQHVAAACQRYGVEITLKDPETESPAEDRTNGAQGYVLTLDGTDEPGVMRALSTQLVRYGIDVTQMHALRSEEEADEGGTAVRGGFHAVMDLAVPTTVDPEELRTELESLGERLGLETCLVRAHGTENGPPRPVRVVLPAGKPR